MENEENQNQVSLRFPPPLEIAPRFPHFHNPDDDSPLPKTQNQKTRKEPQRLKKPQPPSSGSSFDEKMLWRTRFGLFQCIAQRPPALLFVELPQSLQEMAVTCH